MVKLLKIIERIKNLKGFSTKKQVASELGLSAQDLSKREKSGASSLLAIITDWGVNQKVNLNWLLTGEGSPYIKGEEENNGPEADADPEVNELLNMTRAVIKSDTGYALSLKANIRSFHDAVETRQEIQNLEQRIAKMENSRGGNQNGGDAPQSTALKINNDPIKKSGT